MVKIAGGIKINKGIKIDCVSSAGSWGYYKTVTIDHLEVAGDETNFIVFIKLASDANLAANARNDGYDIKFTNSTGLTDLKYERVFFDGATGELVAHVKVPSLSSGVDTVIRMYYGNAGASDQQDPDNVWTDYDFVLHMKEDPTSAGGDEILDSSSNNRDFTTAGTMVTADSVTGKLHKALDFDETDDRLSHADFAYGDADDFSISIWLKLSNGNVGSLYKYFLSHGAVTLVNSLNAYINEDSATSGDKIESYIKDGANNGDALTGVTGVDDGAWHLVHFTKDTNGYDMYLDGSNEDTEANCTSTVNPTTSFYIACREDVDGGRMFGGQLEEARFRKDTLSTNWISTEYGNQNNPSNFYTLGAQQST
jgi:hypothetical protein